MTLIISGTNSEGHDHHGLALGQRICFVFRNMFVFRLIVAVLGKLRDSLFVPSGRICLAVFLGHWIDPGAQLHSDILSI
jgi:hypothetical protein